VLLRRELWTVPKFKEEVGAGTWHANDRVGLGKNGAGGGASPRRGKLYREKVKLGEEDDSGKSSPLREHGRGMCRPLPNFSLGGGKDRGSVPGRREKRGGMGTIHLSRGLSVRRNFKKPAIVPYEEGRLRFGSPGESARRGGVCLIAHERVLAGLSHLNGRDLIMGLHSDSVGGKNPGDRGALPSELVAIQASKPEEVYPGRSKFVQLWEAHKTQDVKEM